MRRVEVRTPSRVYDVVIGSGLLPRLGALVQPVLQGEPRHAAFFFDDALPEATWEPARASLLDELDCEGSSGRFTVPESLKTLESVEAVTCTLAAGRHERTDPVVALGGGVLGDVVGFAAAIYRRGVPWINCPTTLLAMVDASVGGKTGVNLAVSDDAGGVKKNMVGAFHQPLRVIADVDTLATLPDRELRCGLAECIKHGMLGAAFGDETLLAWTEANADRFLARDAGATAELVARNVAVKAAVVGGDEREEADEGRRALLNLGHTFGHAIETLPSLSHDGTPAGAPLRHGEAVGLGLVAASRSSEALGIAPRGSGDRVADVLRRIGLPIAVAGLPPDDRLMALMADDKKVRGGRLRLVLPEGQGRCRVVDDPPADAVRAGWSAIRR